MTWLSLPQTEASVTWLKEHFPNPGSSLEWVGARWHFRAWVNVDTGSVVVVRGVGELGEAGFIATSLRPPGSASPIALSVVADNKYVSADDALDLKPGFDFRLEESAAAVAETLSL